MSRIKVLIADDQTIIRDGLRSILNHQDDMEVVGTVEPGMRLYEMTAEMHPNVVITDIKMQGSNRIENIRLIKRDYPDTVVIMLTTIDDEEYVIEALTSGVSGYLLKNMPEDNLIQAIRNCASGNLSLPLGLAQKITTKFYNMAINNMRPSKLLMDELSEREKEISHYLVRGYTNKQIAATLFITEGTVKNYISSIYSKLGINDRTKAVIFLREHGVA